MFDSRTARLLTLLPWLSAQTSASLSDMAAKFNLTESKLISDLTTLTLTGPGQYGGDLVDIHFSDGVVTIIDSQGFDKPSKLTRDEANLLALTLLNLLPYFTEPVSDVATRLVSKLLQSDEIVHVVEDTEVDTAEIEAIVAAIKSKKLLKFEYQSEREKTSRIRIINPNCLEWRRGELYLDGICIQQQSERTFAVHRIHNLETLPELSSQSELKSNQDLNDKSTKLEMRLEIQNRLVDYFNRYPDFKLIDKIDDRSMVTFSVYNENHAISLVLKFYDSINAVWPTRILDNANKEIQRLVGIR